MKFTLFFLLLLSSLSVHSQSTIGKKCNNSAKCQDGNWCNGREVCAPNANGKKRCQAAPRTPCGLLPGMTCNEAQRKCEKVLCQRNSDCADNFFCNGREVCDPSRFGNHLNQEKKIWGCSRPQSPCSGNTSSCDEDRNRCFDPNCVGGLEDRDGDGVNSVRCGGGDCDDNDPNRFPGNPEICDSQNRDEDCDPSTFGKQDRDGDGQVSSRCCNRRANGTLRCGPDCNDNNPIIVLGAQMCVQNRDDVVNICGQGLKSCGQGMKCIAQPNGLGICAP